MRVSPTERYRLQSDVFESMWLVVQSFIERVQAFQRRGGVKDFQLSYSGIVPLTEYFELIDTHLEVRVWGRSLKSALRMSHV